MKSIRKMIRNVRQNDPSLFAYFIVNAFSSGLEPILSVFALQLIVTQLTAAEGSVRRVVLTILTYILVSTVLKIVAIQSDHRSWGRFAFLRMEYVRGICKKLLTMDYAYYENPSFFNEKQSCIEAVSNNNVGLEGIYHKLFSLAGKVISILVLSVVISYFHPIIVVVLLCSVVASVFAMRKSSQFTHSKKPELNQAGRRVSRLYETSSNFEYGKDIRLFNLKGHFLGVFQKEIDNFKDVYTVIVNKEFTWNHLPALVSAIAELVMYGVLTYGVLNGLSIAHFTMYLVSVTFLTAKMREVATDIGFIRDQLLYVDDFYDFLDSKLITENSSRPFTTTSPVKIEFVNVSFKYPGTERYVIQDLNLTIAPSEKLAIVGVNGGGKTTLVKLLSGMYRPTNGKILVNGEDYLDMSLSSLQDLIAMVSQEVQPLAFSIGENVSSSETYDSIRIEECLKQVGLWDKISSFPRGIETPLLKILDEDGVILSGGENQKLMIARALYKEGTQLMIMDEPTAALDALAEEKIYREMNEIMEGKTAIFISHRIASTQFCDKIVLLDGGNVKEIGTHQTLMASGGIYREMFETQAKYYRETVEEAI